MPGTVRISSPDDPRLADYTRLTDVGLRTHLEAEHGLFMAEGTKVIRRAVEGGYSARSVLLAESRLADLPALHLPVPVYVVPDEVAEGLTGYHVHRGALASCTASRCRPSATCCDARRVVVLEAVRPHQRRRDLPQRRRARRGRRAAVARCADPLYRRSVKVSMGAVFAIPYARMTEWFDGLAELKAGGFRVLALTPDERATPIGAALEAASGGRAALLFGTEGDGLSARWLRTADETVRIPMRRGRRLAQRGGRRGDRLPPAGERG